MKQTDVFIAKVFFNVLFLAAVLTIVLTWGCGKNSIFNRDSSEAQIVLNGAGATFPSPVYANWSYNYSESTDRSILINYQGIGSSAGINQLNEGTIDFAGTDAPLNGDEQHENGIVQFPMLAGGIVVIVNVPGVKNNELKLSQKTLVDIFLGKIKKWNDPAIAAENPELKLPSLDITVVRRSDGSGTTFLFTEYLSKISPEWSEKVGAGKAVAWPVGLGGQKNPGVCAAVSKISGSIGYTEFTYAVEAKLTMPALQNAAGKYVVANEYSFGEAFKKADWKGSNDFCLILVNIDGDESWPILGATYLLYKKELRPDKKQALFDYVNWCFDAGKSAAQKMRYLPLPNDVVSEIRQKTGI